MNNKVPLKELEMRQERFRSLMKIEQPDWQMAVIFSKINLYYFTGTMQEGMLLIPRNDETVFWVRRSYERACDESFFPRIKPMDSFRDAAAYYPSFQPVVHLETEFVPIAFLQRFQKYFPSREVLPLDQQIAYTRSVKSAYELDIIRRCGEMHRVVLQEKVPTLLREGMSEVDFAGILYATLLDAGHHGLARFGMFDTEMLIGHIAFGESSLYPTSFNGPGGSYGMSPAVPLLGNRERKLTKGDLIFIDIAFGLEGYHTDKTQVYLFGREPDPTILREHRECIRIQEQLAGSLRPGTIPSKLYEEAMNNLPPAFLKNFMGYGNRQVKFLGHGIGLVVDEIPAIAKGFDKPLQENMVMALEPKKGIKDVGMVGVENTFIITPEGGKCITGSDYSLITV
jgi:Xaa-Pro dipeptidase